MNLIAFKNITKRFAAQFVLHNFSFDINEGDKVIISGRSGIGKTTLFRLLLGFEQPEEGIIYFHGKPLTEKTVWELRREVAYVSQDLNIGNGKVSDFFAETLYLKANHKIKTIDEGEIESMISYFELPEGIMNKLIEELSGGEKQRVAIINALLLQRKIFLLDEISSALDKGLKEKVIDYFLRRADFTVLYISHDHYLPKDIEVKTLQLATV